MVMMRNGTTRHLLPSAPRKFESVPALDIAQAEWWPRFKTPGVSPVGGALCKWPPASTSLLLCAKYGDKHVLDGPLWPAHGSHATIDPPTQSHFRLHTPHGDSQYGNPRVYEHMRRMISITGVRSAFGPPSVVPSEATKTKGLDLSYEAKLSEAMQGFGGAVEQLLAKTGALRPCCWAAVRRGA